VFRPFRFSSWFGLILIFPTLVSCQSGDTQIARHFQDTYLVKTPESSRVALYLVYVNEPDDEFYKEGLAHYTEHLVIYGITDSDAKIAKQHSNAWTNSSTIGYWFSGEKNDLNTLLETLSRSLQPLDVNPAFAQEEIAIILREYDYRMVDNVYHHAVVAGDKFLYQGNKLARSPMGTRKSITSLTYDDAKAFHLNTHKQKNAVLVVVGNVSENEINQAMQQANTPTLEDARVAPLAVSTFKLAGNQTERLRFDSAAERRIVIRRIVELQEPVSYELLALNLNLLSDILNSSLTGGLGGPLHYDQPLTHEFSIRVFPLNEHHVELNFEANPSNEVSFEELEIEFTEAMQEISNGITASTFNRIHDRLLEDLPDIDDSKAVSDWMADYVLGRVSRSRVPLSMQEIRKLSANLQLSDVNNLLQAMQAPGRQVVILIGKNIEDES